MEAGRGRRDAAFEPGVHRLVALFVCRDGRFDATGFAVRAALAVARAVKHGIRMARPFVQWPAHAYHPAGRPVYDGGSCRP